MLDKSTGKAIVRLAQCIEFQIDRRDEAAQAFSQAYYLVTGTSPKWSNTFGYDEALEEIKDACTLLRAHIRKTDTNIHG